MNGQPSLFGEPDEMPVLPPRVGFAGQEPPRHRNRDPQTSRAAADALNPRVVGARCLRYLEVIAAAGARGATRDDVADIVDARGAEDRALSRRITDLCQAGLVVDSGRRRPGGSGRLQTVYVAVDVTEAATAGHG